MQADVQEDETEEYIKVDQVRGEGRHLRQLGQQSVGGGGATSRLNEWTLFRENEQLLDEPNAIREFATVQLTASEPPTSSASVNDLQRN